MGAFISTLLIGVLSGLVSSLFYFLFMRAVKPKIKVAPSIVVETTDKATNYYVKIVNKTRGDLIDVYYTFQIYSVSPDEIINIGNIKPMKSVLRHIDKHRKSKNDTYAVRLSFSDREKRTLSENSYLVFTFYATHAFSGRRMLFQTKYEKNN